MRDYRRWLVAVGAIALFSLGFSVTHAGVDVHTDEAVFLSLTWAAPVPIPDALSTFGSAPTACGLTPVVLPAGLNALTATQDLTAPSNASRGLCIFDAGAVLPPANTNPNVMTDNTLTGNGEDDILFVFDIPVRAVGLRLLTNFSAAELVTLWDASGNPISTEDIDPLTPTNVRQFVGFVSSTPIKSMLIDTLNGHIQNEAVDKIWITTMGSCCENGPGTETECAATTQHECESGNGLYLGDGTECSSDLDCQALLVIFESMTAVATADGVQLRWTTTTEVDTIGFRVLRETPGRALEKGLELLSEMIPAAGHGLTGATYEFLDDSKQSAFAVRYYVADIDIFGKVTQHGPISVQRGTRVRGAASHRVRKRVDR